MTSHTEDQLLMMKFHISGSPAVVEAPGVKIIVHCISGDLHKNIWHTKLWWAEQFLGRRSTDPYGEKKIRFSTFAAQLFWWNALKSKTKEKEYSGKEREFM